MLPFRTADRLRTPAAARALLLLFVVMVLGLWAVQSRVSDPLIVISPDERQNDAVLYKAVVERVRGGTDYHTAAVSEQRQRGYPLHPFVTVRPPALALLLAAFPAGLSAVALYMGLGLSVVLVWWGRISAPGAVPGRPPSWTVRVLPATGLASGLLMALVTPTVSIYFHEIWAGFLIALSLGLRTDKHFEASVAAGLAAGLLRELAIPFLGLMAVLALAEGRRKETAAFAAAAVVALLTLCLHAWRVQSMVTPGDLASPGWVKFSGLGFLLTTVKVNLFSAMFGLGLTAMLIPLALFGAFGWSAPIARRLLGTLLAYGLTFLVIGRPTNVYWGFLIAPVIGLCAASGLRVLYGLIQRVIGDLASPQRVELTP